MKAEFNEVYSDIAKIIQKEKYTWIYRLLLKDENGKPKIKMKYLEEATGLTRQRLNQIKNEIEKENEEG